MMITAAGSESPTRVCEVSIDSMMISNHNALAVGMRWIIPCCDSGRR